VIKAFPLMLLRGTPLEHDRERWNLHERGVEMPVVVSSSTFNEDEWEWMASISEALKATEDTGHPGIDALLDLAASLPPDMDRWMPAVVDPGQPPVFIVLEGLDGSGKTVIAEQVAREIGGVLLTTPSLVLRGVREAILDGLGPNPESHQLFYLGTVYAVAREVRAALASGRPVVMDRYYLSTAAYAAFRGSMLDTDPLSLGLVPADLTVFLDVPRDVRASRLAARHDGEPAADDAETLSPEADERLRAEHKVRAHLPVIGEWIEMDGTMSPGLIVRRVIEAVRRWQAAAALQPRRGA
ncbi:MAG: dTMP kinase, partial [Vicinamibacterales bacterium]